MSSEFEEVVPTKRKVAFGLVNAAVSTLSGIGLGSAITFFYNIKLGLSEDLTSLAWIIFAIWNAVNDPLFGILEEKTNTKMGRRKPYLIYGAPLFALTFIFCWFPVFGSSQNALFWNLLLVLFLFDSTFTMIGLITYTLPAEMCITQKARASMSTYTIILGAIGMLISMVVPMILLTGDESTALDPAFQPTMVILGIVSCLVIVFFSRYLKENEYAVEEETLGFFQSIKETLKNRAFLIFEANNFFYQIAWTIITSSMTYYIQYVLNLSGIMSSVPLLIVYLMVFVFIIPSGILTKKKGLKKVYMVGLVIAALGSFLLFIAQKNMIFAYISLAVIGIGYSPINLTNGPLMQDIIDYDEILTGKRRETTYAGMNALFTKPSISIGNAVFLSIISAFGFDNKADTQTLSAQSGIIFAYTIVPVVFLIIAFIAIKFFTLDGPKWAEQKRELAFVHQRKEEEYVAKIQKKMRDSNPS